MNAPRPDPMLETVWRFVRGDLAPAAFERWLCETPGAEQRLGPALFLELVSADWRLADAVASARLRLAEFAARATKAKCRCERTADRAVLAMAPVVEEVATLDVARLRGEPRWWLSARTCRACGQAWLVGEESRVNDVFVLRRLGADEAARLLGEGVWPPDLDTYEALLRAGNDAGFRVVWDDPENAVSLLATVADLAREKPHRPLSELAALLRLDPAVARSLAQWAIDEEGADVELER